MKSCRLPSTLTHLQWICQKCPPRIFFPRIPPKRQHQHQMGSESWRCIELLWVLWAQQVQLSWSRFAWCIFQLNSWAVCLIPYRCAIVGRTAWNKRSKSRREPHKLLGQGYEVQAPSDCMKLLPQIPNLPQMRQLLPKFRNLACVDWFQGPQRRSGQKQQLRAPKDFQSLSDNRSFQYQSKPRMVAV